MSRARTRLKRPYATHYFHSPHDRSAAQVSQGAASSEQGAIRASVVRVFLGQYKKCVVYDRETGAALYTLRVGPGGIRVEYGSGVEFKEYKEA